MQNTKRILLCCICLATTFHNCPANQIVYDNGVGGFEEFSYSVLSDEDWPFFVADDVTLTTPQSIRGVHWGGVYARGDGIPPVIDDFTIDIFTDNGGVPMDGTPLASFHVGNAVNRIDTGVDLFADDIYEFSAEIDFNMVANTTYWISIYTNSVGEDDDFGWGAGEGAGNGSGTATKHLNWANNGDQMDFRLSVIPEPGSGLILLSGCCLLAIRRLR